MAVTNLDAIMLPVRGDGKGDNVLAHAAALARRHGARVRVVNCAPRTKDMIPYGVVLPRMFREQIEAAMSAGAHETELHLIEEFKALAGKFGLAEEDHQTGKATARFIHYEGKQVDAVKTHGRLVDLICVPKPDAATNLGFNTLKSALFTSGRPVMMCPDRDTVEDGFADHVVIAWNGSIEATRAVAMTMPFCYAAKQVTILSGNSGDMVPGPEDLQRYLELKGVQANLHIFSATKDNVGAQLLEQTMSLGGGVLVMGAYHESYERESLFGGNSQSVVEAAEIPVVLVH